MPSKVGTIVLITFAGVVLAGAIWYFSNTTRPAPQTIPQNQNQRQSVEASFQKILPNSQIGFPEVSSSAVLGDSEFPEDLVFLLSHAPAERTVKKINFSTGQVGYQVEFIASEPMLISHQKYRLLIRNSKPWVQIFGGRDDLVSIIEAEHPNYQLRITQEYINASSSSVAILVVNNQ